MAKTDIFIVGVGGQGSLSASWFIGEAANRANLKVLVGEVHGMAQRGGIVESTVRIGDVHGPIIPERGAEVLLGFEPVETLRFIRMISPSSLVITNTSQLVPANVSMSGGSYPEAEATVAEIGRYCKNVIALDATDLARQAGTAKAINAVMLGALAAQGVLPFDATLLKETVLSKVPPRARDINALAFDRGMAFVKENAA